MRHLLALTLVATPTLVGAFGCDEPEPTLGTFDQTVCLDTTPELAIQPNAEYVAFRSVGGNTGTVIASWGEPCAGAADAATKESCLTDLASVKAVTPVFLVRASNDGGGTFDVVVTEGGQPRAIATRGELLAALGPIDTPTEAVLAAFATNLVAECEANVRTESDGFVVRVSHHGDCVDDPGDQMEAEAHVSADGKVEQDPWIIPPGGICTTE